MRKLIVCAAMALTLGMAGLAQAGCTAEEAQQKAATFAQVVQAKAQQDPEGYAKVMQELQPELLQIQQKQDVDALCAFYDQGHRQTEVISPRILSRCMIGGRLPGRPPSVFPPLARHTPQNVP